MSKKFVVFKLFHDLNDTCESEILSELELSSFLTEFETIQNVFQLQQNTDLKLLINKSEQLQDLLTQDLPLRGFRHAYLWSGEDLPDIPKILANSGLIYECFLFQRSTDALPAFNSTATFKLSRRLDIYNWYVYHLKSFEYYLTKTALIRQNSTNEREIDDGYAKLWEDFKNELKPKKTLINEHPQKESGKTNKYFLLDRRAYSKHFDYRWVRAIINYLTPLKNSRVYIPFTNNGNIFNEALLSGKEVIGAEINPLRCVFAQGKRSFLEINLPEFSRAISALMSQIKLFTSNNEHVQADLFLSDVEKQFNEFWQSEKDRIKSLEINQITNEDLKVIAASRLLIDSGAITKSSTINTLLLSALINLLSKTLKMREVPDLVDEFYKELRTIYLDIYTFQQIKQLIQLQLSNSDVVLQNATNAKMIPDCTIDAIFGFFPSNISGKGFRKDKTIIEILNLFPNLNSLEKLKFGTKESLKEKNQVWVDEISQKKSMYALLGDYGQLTLLKFLDNNRQSEAGSMLKLWMDTYYFLLECSRILNDGAKACLVFDHPLYKIQNDFEEVKVSKVARELIEKHKKSMNLQIIKELQKPIMSNRFGQKQYIYILFFQKDLKKHNPTDKSSM